MDDQIFERRRSRTMADFLEEVPLPKHSQEDHERLRLATYGRNPPEKWEGAQQEEYDEYKRNQSLSTSCRIEYNKQEKKAKSEFGMFVGDDDEKKTYYNQTTGGLLPRQHRELAPVASELEDAAYHHAIGRHDYLKDYPVSQTTVTKQKEHHMWAKVAYKDHALALKAYNRHAQYASPARDLYGQEVPARSRPSERPYPPAPPPGYYSTEHTPALDDPDRPQISFSMTGKK
ncbi:hypothetical protein VTN77DRAFT_4796 [Rasamsonia byssochlamydoides]|uniref:uncharacterized protein n=1 Tax=Rasamsonia byssochlamydoides TaxID=89139 RepID=UPI003742D5A1